MFVMKFLRQLSELNPQLRSFKQIKLYSEAIVQKNQQKNKILGIVLQINKERPSFDLTSIHYAFKKWSKIRPVDQNHREAYSN